MGEAILARASSGGGGGALEFERVETSLQAWGVEKTITFNRSLSKVKAFAVSYGSTSYYCETHCFDGKGNLIDDFGDSSTITLRITNDTTLIAKMEGYSSALVVSIVAIF